MVSIVKSRVRKYLDSISLLSITAGICEFSLPVFTVAESQSPGVVVLRLAANSGILTTDVTIRMDTPIGGGGSATGIMSTTSCTESL